MTGPNPTDRGKLGSKIHVICDRNGLPLSIGISGANLHDSQALVPLMHKVAGIPGVRARSFTKFTDAKQWLAHAQTDVTRQEFVDPREGTILRRAYVEERWWPHQRYAATTRDAARRRIWGHVLLTLGPLSLNAITAPALREWVALLEETLSPGTIRTIGGISLRSFRLLSRTAGS